MSKQNFRQSVSIPGLLKTTRQIFEQIPDSKSSSSIPLADHLMSGLAIFGLKYPSLLQFDQDRNVDLTRSNLKSLYGIKQAPSDTYLRERLDEVDPAHLRKNYTQLLQVLQRGKGLEGFAYLDNHYLLSLDGTGYFSSHDIHCDQCGEKHHRDGRVSYYHQLLGAVLVHPDYKEVFPLAPEPILKQDGSRKNDCERNAAKRFLNDTRREHPHMKFIVIEDALASNAPHIKLLQALNYRYLLGAKQTDHKFLFDWVDNTSTTITHEQIDGKGVIHRFRYLNNAPLNNANFELEINFLEYWEIKPAGRTTHFSWVTDIPITQDNLMQLMRGARARWKVENETFNTLKNHGYHFEHNFGHGYHHLSTVMVHLMMLAFLIDQIQQRCCGLFNRALDKAQSKTRFWQKMRNLFQSFLIPHWEAMYLGIANELKPTVIPYNTS
ncbi:MAG: transposase [Gammaproteobacteria bacterium]|nr:transposase [Gammaproteobacteria bacterium]